MCAYKNVHIQYGRLGVLASVYFIYTQIVCHKQNIFIRIMTLNTIVFHLFVGLAFLCALWVLGVIFIERCQ